MLLVSMAALPSGIHQLHVGSSCMQRWTQHGIDDVGPCQGLAPNQAVPELVDVVPQEIPRQALQENAGKGENRGKKERANLRLVHPFSVWGSIESIDVVQLNRLNVVGWGRSDLMDVLPCWNETTNARFNQFQPSHKFPTTDDQQIRGSFQMCTWSWNIRWPSSHVPGSILEYLNLKQQAAAPRQK